MKMKHMTILALLTALLLTACAPAVSNPAKDTTPPTVADIFNEPTTATTETTDATEPTEKAAPQTVLVGSIGLGFGDEVSTDEKGSYRIYSGGEMILPVKLTTSGTIAERGIGMLLFVDGKPQPYKTEAEPEYAYLHTFFQGQGPKVYDLSFTPITGQTGEVLELYIATVLSPTYSLSEGMISGHLCKFAWDSCAAAHLCNCGRCDCHSGHDRRHSLLKTQLPLSGKKEGRQCFCMNGKRACFTARAFF